MPEFRVFAKGFNIPIEGMRLRKHDSWEILDTLNPDVDAIYEYFVRAPRKGADKVFRAKPFTADLVIPAATWQQVEAHIEATIDDDGSVPNPPLAGSQARTARHVANWAPEPVDHIVRQVMGLGVPKPTAAKVSPQHPVALPMGPTHSPHRLHTQSHFTTPPNLARL